MHDMAGHGDHVETLSIVVVAVAGLVAVGYVTMVALQRRRGRSWSIWRTTSFLIGIGLVAWSLWTPWLPFEPGDLRQHMLQHLLIGMYAPLAIILAAPLTLLFRTLPPGGSRRVGSVLRSAPMQVLAHPVTALALNVGGLVALYFTPLYGWLMERPLAHATVHVHFLLAGCLFAWVIAGADPVPHRLRVPRRLFLVGVAVAAHAVVAQLIYAGIGVQFAATDAERRGAGDLMYFGGDIAEVLLALAVVTTWRDAPAARPAASRCTVTPKETVAV